MHDPKSRFDPTLSENSGWTTTWWCFMFRIPTDLQQINTIWPWTLFSTIKHLYQGWYSLLLLLFSLWAALWLNATDMNPPQSGTQMLVGSVSHPGSVCVCACVQVCVHAFLYFGVCLSVWCSYSVYVCVFVSASVRERIRVSNACECVMSEKNVWLEDQSPSITPQSVSQLAGQPAYCREAPLTTGDVELLDSHYFN